MRKGGLLVGMAIGAGLVYLLDPESGECRGSRLRTRIQDRLGDERRADLSIEMPIGHYGSRRATFSAWSPRPRAQSDRRVRDRLAGAGGRCAHALRRRPPGSHRRRGADHRRGDALEGDARARAARTGPGASDGRTVDIQKTLFVGAPVERVYEFWTDYENFPLFMSNVREVQDLGGGRSHWVVSGPGGVPIEWDSVLTEQVPGETIAWRSRPGSMLENAGVVRFRAGRRGHPGGSPPLLQSAGGWRGRRRWPSCWAPTRGPN